MLLPEVAAVESVWRLVDRPLWIVTSASESRRGGLVATWVAQASLDPRRPVAMIALAPHHHTTELVQTSGALALHLLKADQIDLVWRFGLSSGRTHDKLLGLAVTVAETGSPVLADCLAWLDCRLLTHYDGGDRLYFWADIVAGGQRQAGEPLCEQAMLAASSDEQRRILKANVLADTDLLSAQRDAWRARFARPEIT